MALILKFPPECTLTTQEIAAMVSAVLDEQPETRDSGYVYKWMYAVVVRSADGLTRLCLHWGKLSSVYQPALAWGAIEEKNE